MKLFFTAAVAIAVGSLAFGEAIIDVSPAPEKPSQKTNITCNVKECPPNSVCSSDCIIFVPSNRNKCITWDQRCYCKIGFIWDGTHCERWPCINDATCSALFDNTHCDQSSHMCICDDSYELTFHQECYHKGWLLVYKIAGIVFIIGIIVAMIFILCGDRIRRYLRSRSSDYTPLRDDDHTNYGS